MITDEGVEMPRRQTLHSCGYDFYAPHDIDIVPGEWVTVDTGVRFDGKEVCELPMGPVYSAWFMMLVPRSGLGSKYGFRFKNTMGIIDQDYRDNIRMTITADVPLHIDKGDRIAQGILLPWLRFSDEIQPTKLREGGFGSTGVKG